MIQLAVKRIWNRKKSTVITVLAMVCFFILVPIGVENSRESQLKVTETLEVYSRGSYDLLIRSKGSRTLIENELGVVEDNYIGDGKGGISIEQWQAIKQNPEVEIAAPVASLGYFSGNTSAVKLPLLDYPARFTWQFYTSDGVEQFPISESLSMFYLGLIDNSLWYSEETYPYPANPPNALTSGMSAFLPQNYYLLTAIDAESEKALTGIDFSTLYREIGEEDEETLSVFLQYRNNPPVIPILQREDLHIPLSLSVKVEKLDFSLSEFSDKYDVPEDSTLTYELQLMDEEVQKRFENELLRLPIIEEEHYTYDLTEYQHPFDGTYLTIDHQLEIGRATEAEGGGALYNDTGYYYTAAKVPYIIDGEQIHVEIAEAGPPPEYKKIEEHGQSYFETMDAPYMLWQLGTFRPPKEENALTSSPLGIYSTEKVKKTAGIEMTPTISPGSFIATPAAGVTTLEAAELLKGDKPIDAVRVKLNGIERYDEAAQERIENLATMFMEQGYMVDIVAGSSFQTLHLNVEGIGEVTSPWTTLGVAQTLTNSWNVDMLLNIILLSTLGLVWFAARFYFERANLAAENHVLLLLGWSETKIRLRNWYEQFLLLGLSFLVACLLLLFIGQTPAMNYFIMTFFWIVSLIIMSGLVYFKQKEQNRSRGYKRFAGVLYYWALLFPVMVILLLSVMIIQLQLSSIFTLYIASAETTLGAFTFGESVSFRLAVLAVTLLLTITGISEAFEALLKARAEEFEMLYTIGWSNAMIKKHVGKEVLVWAGSCFILGTLISAGAMMLLQSAFLPAVIGVTVSLVILATIILAMLVFKKIH
ncbi:putative ABC transport system permease protein [Evansella caseinilytica]|uniref:Putative ABC transport system permease protein n=1 Tax=Evansella caseinilytica TaxID=1503961 RepID=A0A1H3UX81_9BACI|nr:ABC transporter permease [Evansella caseinilytica]SDZ66896.1 putative ABC transport system permease protein [Evansella caseinilytica]